MIKKQRLIHKLVTAYVKHKKKQGWTIILWTLRGNKPEKEHDGLDQAIQFCSIELDLSFDYVNDNPPEMTEAWGYSRKLAYDILIDDKNIGIIGWLLRMANR